MTHNNYINIVRTCFFVKGWWSYVFLLNMPCNNYTNLARTWLWKEMNEVLFFYSILSLWEFSLVKGWWSGLWQSYVFLLIMTCNNYINIVRLCFFVKGWWSYVFLFNMSSNNLHYHCFWKDDEVMFFCWTCHVTIT
jgi:hypothetical protein